MQNRTSINDDTVVIVFRVMRDNGPPEPVVVAPKVTSNALAFASDVHGVSTVILDVGRHGGFLTRKEQFMHCKRVLAMRVGGVPEHPEHATDPARAVDLDLWSAPVRRRGRCRGLGSRRSTKDIAKEGEHAHSMIS